MSKEKVILGMDIGGTGMRAALVNAKGEIRGRFVDENRKKETLEHIGQVIEILRGEGNDLELETVGIGIGLAGLVDPETELLVSSPTMVSMEGMNFRKEIEAISKLPVVINNDANSAGYAEWKLGAGTQTNSAVALFVGTGVGGAIILDGDLYVGKDGVAGEVGHLVVSTDGPDCPCGGKGCLEQLGSGTAVHRFIEKSLQQGRQSSLSLVESTDGHKVLSAARAGDELSIEAYEEIGKWLGVAVASLANLLNVEVAILGGGAMAAHEFILPAVMKRVDKHTMKIQKKTLKVQRNTLDRKAGTIGAALLALKKQS